MADERYNRGMQKTIRDMSVAESSPVAEGFPRADEAGPIKFRPPSTLLQIVGFSPKIPFGSKEGNVHLPADPAKIISSLKSARPASGLESLFRTPPISSTRDITVDRTIRTKVHIVHNQHSSVFQNNPKRSRPIPICQSKKLQNEFCAPVQEHQPDQGYLSSDGPVRPYRNQEAAFPEDKILHLKPQHFKLVQESHNASGVEKSDFGCPFSFSDQKKLQAHALSFATMDFMKACFLCKRKLEHGLDIYMYRGDKAFCSMDCRNHQIVIDERSERRGKCSSAALVSASATKSTRSNHRNGMPVASTVTAA